MKVQNKFLIYRSALAEIASIVIAVLLALAVNEWNENRVHKQRADEAIQNIIKEIDANIKFIGFVNVNNKAIIELLKGEIKVIEGETDKQFVPGLQIQDTAWKTLHATGVSEYLEYSTLYELSTLYSLQEIYKRLGYQLVQNTTNIRVLLAAVTSGKTSDFDNNLFLPDMILIEQIESALLDGYSKALDKIKKVK